MPTLASSGPNSGPNGLGPAGALLADSAVGGFSDVLEAAFAALGVGKGRDIKATTRLAMPIPQYLSAEQKPVGPEGASRGVVGGKGTRVVECIPLPQLGGHEQRRQQAPQTKARAGGEQRRSASGDGAIMTDRCCTHLFSCIHGAHFAPQTHVIAAWVEKEGSVEAKPQSTEATMSCGSASDTSMSARRTA